MPVSYSATEDGDLVVNDGRGVRWHGRPDGYRVATLVPLPGTTDAIVLLEEYSTDVPTRFENVVRIDPDGRTMWRAAPPTKEDVGSASEWISDDGSDFRVSLSVDTRGGVAANSWSCFWCVLDPDTGRITAAVFTK